MIGRMTGDGAERRQLLRHPNGRFREGTWSGPGRPKLTDAQRELGRRRRLRRILETVRRFRGGLTTKQLVQQAGVRWSEGYAAVRAAVERGLLLLRPEGSRVVVTLSAETRRRMEAEDQAKLERLLR